MARKRDLERNVRKVQATLRAKTLVIYRDTLALRREYTEAIEKLVLAVEMVGAGRNGYSRKVRA
jgi:hypothetical protein